MSAEGETVTLKNFQARGDEVESWFKDLEENTFFEKNSFKNCLKNPKMYEKLAKIGFQAGAHEI